MGENKHITDYFDIISGTSTGGIIALLLSTPDQDGKPKYNASDMLELYNKLGSKVFKRSIWQKAKTGWGWWGAKYSSDNLEELLIQYFGEIELKDVIKTVIVPAYEIEMDKSFFFKSERAKIYPKHNYKLKDIARATSAAPTYFEPAQIQ
ncbi:MAG: patatin, partial [Sphingobacteriaceae bacterium]